MKISIVVLLLGCALTYAQRLRGAKPNLHCVNSCKMKGNCLDRMVFEKDHTEDQCDSCVMQTCTSVDTTNMVSMAACDMAARISCESCPTVSNDDRVQRMTCMQCLKQCPRPARENEDRERPRQNQQFRPSAASTSGRVPQSNARNQGSYPRLGGQGGILGRQGPPQREIQDREQGQIQRRPGPPGRHHGYGPRPSSCAKSCVSEDRCPTPREVLENMKKERRECRDCVIEMCGPVAKMGNRSALAKCIREARMKCTDCSIPTAGDVKRMENCNECLKNCTPGDLDNNNDEMFGFLFGQKFSFGGILGRSGPFQGGRSGISNILQNGFQTRGGPLQYGLTGMDGASQGGPKNRRFPKLVKCMIECRREGECLHHRFNDDISDEVEECRDCVTMECGSLDGDERMEKMDCVIEARANCSACPGTPEEKSGMRRCAKCVHRCVARGERPGPPGRHHGFGPRPSSCAKSCVSEDKCPTPREVLENMKKERKECRGCVIKMCGPVAKMGNRSALAKCIREARMKCTDCSVPTAGDVKRMENCNKCLKNCTPGDLDNNNDEMFGFLFGQKFSFGGIFGRSGPFQGGRSEISNILQNGFQARGGPLQYGLSGMNGPPQGSSENRKFPKLVKCMIECRREGECSHHRFDDDISDEVEECRDCVTMECGSLNGNERMEKMDCLIEARANCSACPGTPEEKSGMRRCAKCVHKCVARGERPGPPGRHHGFGPRPSSCVKSCVSEDRCPTPREVLANMMEERKECRDCVIKMCGPVAKMGNRSALAKCIREARMKCTDCSVPTAGDVKRMENCNECLKNCTPGDLDMNNDEMFGFLFGQKFSFGEILGRSGPFQSGRSGISNILQNGFQTRGGPLQYGLAEMNGASKGDSKNKRFPRLVKCMIECRREGECSHHRFDDDISSEVEGCWGCVTMECGSLDGDQRGEKMDCVIEARANCSACPGTPEEKSGMRRCAKCVHRCVARGERPGPPGRHHGFGPRPSPCAKSCVSEDRCPTPREVLENMKKEKKECRNCVVKMCGPVAKMGNRSALARCIREARMKCTDCSVPTAEDVKRMENCTHCLLNCTTDNSSENNDDDMFGFLFGSTLFSQERFPGVRGSPQGIGGSPRGMGGRPQGVGGPPRGIGGPPQGFGGQPQGFGGRPQGFGGRPQGLGGPQQGIGGPHAFPGRRGPPQGGFLATGAPTRFPHPLGAGYPANAGK